MESEQRTQWHAGGRRYLSYFLKDSLYLQQELSLHISKYRATQTHIHLPEV